MFNSPHPVIYHDENITFFLERYEDKLFIHIKVDNWNHTIYKSILGIWFGLLERLNIKKIYAAVATEKIGRFGSMLGFEYTDEWIMYNDGINRRLMVCLG